MPQGRKKVPFSGKAKKEQLKQKKLLKQSPQSSSNVLLAERSDNDERRNKLKVNQQSLGGKSNKSTANRYVLQFQRETDDEIQFMKEQAFEKVDTVTDDMKEIMIENFFNDTLDFPTRPAWNFSISKDQLDAKEKRYFHEYVKKLEDTYALRDLGYLELNLETWRQLWRVLEMSDIILLIVDIRFAAAMFPPSLYDFVTKELNKDMILVLNKVDLVDAPLVVAWKHYFQKKFPSLHILYFTTFPGYNIRGSQANRTGLQSRRRKNKLRMAAECAQTLLETCKDIVKNEVDLTSWEKKIQEELMSEYEDEETEVAETVEVENDTSFVGHVRFKDNVLTIGCIGHPNVGKSSLMNAIMGKKVVSVSRTPGHTKHFQTIFLTQNIRLCDCPGLVFPSLVPKMIQVLMGSFPIAQLRMPYSAIRFMAERCNLPKLLAIKHPANDREWSPVDICEAWAIKRGFYTAKAARPDSYRAANNLLRMQLEGKICVPLFPPRYVSNKDVWVAHSDVEKVLWVQARQLEENSQEAVKFECVEYDTDEIGEDRGASTSNVNKKQRVSPRSDTEKSSSSSSDEEDDGGSRITSFNKFAALSVDD